MMLEDIIDTLEKENPDKVVKLGFGDPHSYRGDYSQLAFEPVENTTIGEMLSACKEARGSTYTGYKGGDYTMTGYTDCYIAKWGECGEEIGPILLRLLLS